MSKYTESPIGYSRLKGGQYRLNCDIHWAIGSEHGPMYHVPAGFIFDVSIPKWLRWLFSRHETKFFRAAALHDHMLHEAGWDRLSAGSQFHQALKADGVPTFTRLIMWLAVSLYKYE